MTHLKPINLACLVGAAVVAGLASGCSGVNTGVGVSPASFLLPGLIMKDPQPAAPFPITPGDTDAVVVAQNH
jgi:hypothetical protein